MNALGKASERLPNGRLRVLGVNDRLLTVRHFNGEAVKGRCSGLELRAAIEPHGERLLWFGCGECAPGAIVGL